MAFALGLALLYALVEALFWRETPENMRLELLSAGGIFLLLSYGLLYWLYHNLTKELLKPLLALGRDLEAQTHAGARIDEKRYHGSLIAPFVGELVREEIEPKGDGDESLNWLSELLHVQDQGLIVANMNHEILLINARAREMFGRQSTLALGRDLAGFLDIQTIKLAIERQLAPGAEGSERLFCRLRREQRVMPGRISLLHSRSGEEIGYVLAFHDYANALFRTQELEIGFDALLRHARDFAGEIALLEKANLPVKKAQERFARTLDILRHEGQAHLGNAWPKGRMTLHNLFRVVGASLPDLDVLEPPQGVYLRCDGAAIVECLEHLLGHLLENGYSLSMSFALESENVKITISSGERKIAIQHVEEAMRQALTRLPTAPTGHEILRAHSTEIWPHMEDNLTNLVFVLERIQTARSFEGARPEYYDFEPRRVSEEMLEVPLRDLAVVVFDTETTGLDPKGGDRVVQLSAVRVKRGKVILDENFDSYVNPERSIPKPSIEIHGVTPKMVKDAPKMKACTEEFFEFCHGEALLAHNAAFDMAFLRQGAKEAALSFDQPVLDTVFMSAFLFDYTGQHTLDDLADRFDVKIPEDARHTALGDAIATAEIFTKMIPMLEARGVENLGQMLEIGKQMRDIRRRQAVYG